MLLDHPSLALTQQCLVLLPGHVGPEDGLHGQGRRLPVSEELASPTHPLVLLDSGGCMNLARVPAGLVPLGDPQDGDVLEPF